MILVAALNGPRSDNEHPAVPRTPTEVAAAARAAVDAGAHVVHVHAFSDKGKETLDPEACAATVSALRNACPQVPISLTTSATIESDPRRRLELVRSWTELPDFVTANQGEDGIAELCELLIGRGVGIEAGLLSVRDAHLFAKSRIASLCTRVLVEPMDTDPQHAVTTAAAMEAILAAAEIRLEQVHHGDGIASWAVSERAAARGHGIRTGLEDTTVLPSGALAADNAELVRYAATICAAAAR